MNKKPKWTGKTYGTRIGHTSFFIIARFFNRFVASFFLLPVKLFYFFFIPKSHDGAKQFFCNVFPGIAAWKLLVFSYKRVSSFADSLLDKVYLQVGGGKGFSVDFPGTKNVLDALELNRGVIVLSAHIGTWEVASRFFSRLQRKVSVIVYEAERPEIKQIQRHLAGSEELPFTFIYINEPVEAIIRIKNALNRNEIVVMHGDRTMGKGIERSFFGKKAVFPTLPYSIAAKTGSPIVVAFCVRLKSRMYRTVTYPFYTVMDDTSESIVQGLQHYCSRLEEIIREYPFQWYNFYRFWD